MTFPLGAAAVTQQPDAGEPLIQWDWLARHLDDIAVRTFEHIQLTAIAVGVGLVVSLALGLVAVRFRWTATPIGWFSGALYAIPSLAFFGLLIPFSGFSIFTAEIALVAYTLSALVRDVIAGLHGAPPAARLREAEGDGVAGKGGVVLDPGEAFLLRGRDYGAVLDEDGGGVVVVGAEAEDAHRTNADCGFRNERSAGGGWLGSVLVLEAVGAGSGWERLPVGGAGGIGAALERVATAEREE